ncbi:MAG TPA: hypothetical protein VJH05_01870 [Candidatus Paceibacterota bacterium]
MTKSKIGIVGLGMVGGNTMRYFSEAGWNRGKDLFCFDADPKKGFSDDVSRADLIFVCVPTPRAKDGSCDTSIVESVVAKYQSFKKVLIIKSTIEPGTAARLQKKYKSPILFNPEFLTESRAWEDFLRPDRQVVGHTEKSLPHAGAVLKLLPKAFFSSPGVLGTYDFVRVSTSEAEMGKYGGNVFGAMKVTYANILADFSEALELTHKKDGINTPVNYENVRKMVSHDARIGDSWMDVKYGKYRGFGGYCFPKDVDAFINFGDKLAKKLNGKNEQTNKKLVVSGLKFLKAIKNYNEELLKSQGLNSKMVSSHDSELKRLLEKRVKKI